MRPFLAGTGGRPRSRRALVWFPRLLHATPAQLQGCELSKRGVHWEGLDEDVSVAGLLQGLGAFSHEGTAA